MKRCSLFVIVLILILMQIPAQALTYDATVIENGVRLRDIAGNYLVDIPKGMKMTIYSYNKSSDMFYVICDDWILRDVYSSYIDGYIKGTGLDVSKNDLVKMFSSTPNPTKTPTPKPTNTSTPKATETTKPTAESENPTNPSLTSSFAINSIKVGNTIKIGHYEQDNRTANGKEPIEWKVLAVDGNRALIISTYGLDTLAYGSMEDSMKEGFSWKTSELRTWLNSSFYNVAFDQSEKSRIINTQVTTNDAFGKFTTNDNLFALSMAEIRAYFSSSSAMACNATEYAKTKLTMRNMDGTTVKDDKYATWWLRDLVSVYKLNGFDSSFNIVALVWANNGINTDTNAGWPFIDNAMVVRPAMWIKLDEEKTVSAATSAPVITPKPEGIDLSVLKGCNYYSYDKFAKEWNVQAYYKKTYSDAELTVYLLLFDNYVESGMGPELRVCFYDKKNLCYDSVTAFRIAVGETIYHFEGMINYDDNNCVFACNTLMELCKALGSGQEIAFQFDHTDHSGNSKTVTIDPVDNKEIKGFIDLAALFDRSNIWSVVKNMKINDSLFNAYID